MNCVLQGHIFGNTLATVAKAFNGREQSGQSRTGLIAGCSTVCCGYCERPME